MKTLSLLIALVLGLAAAAPAAATAPAPEAAVVGPNTNGAYQVIFAASLFRKDAPDFKTKAARCKAENPGGCSGLGSSVSHVTWWGLPRHAATEYLVFDAAHGTVRYIWTAAPKRRQMSFPEQKKADFPFDAHKLAEATGRPDAVNAADELRSLSLDRNPAPASVRDYFLALVAEGRRRTTAGD